MYTRLFQATIFCLPLLLLRFAYAVSPDQLDVTLNAKLLKDSRRVVFGSIVQIQGLHSWTHGEILHLANMAHQARHDAFESDEGVRKRLRSAFGKTFEERLPGVTTTLVIDDVAYISSSMKGGPYFYSMRHNSAPQWRAADLEGRKCADLVRRGLVTCQIASNPVKNQKTGHRTGANCGEVLALQGFCKSGQNDDLEAKLAGAIIVAIRDVTNDEDEITGMEIAKPCSGSSLEWGCQDLLQALGIQIKGVIRPNTQAVSREVPDSDIVTFPASL